MAQSADPTVRIEAAKASGIRFIQLPMDAATIASKGIRELPGTLGEALDELERDPVIRAALGDHVFGHYVEAKRAEWDEYRTQVSDWEVDRYLDQF